MGKLKYFKILTASALLRLKNKEQAQNYLMHAIGKIPGVPAKFSQVLSMKHQWYTADEQIHPNRMETTFVQELIKENNPKLFSQIQDFSDTASVASLSQVHQAILKNGEIVAVKIQFPGLTDEIKEQMKVIHFVLLQSPAISYNFNDQLFIDYFQNQLLSELDYENEAQKQMQIYQHFKNDQILIPRVYEEYSNNLILVQEFRKGMHLNELKLSPYEVRFQVARQMTHFLLNSIFQLGLVHGDFQPQNWAYDIEAQKLIVYDFGSMIQLTKKQQEGLIRLLLSQNDLDTLMGYAQLGFSEKNLSVITDRIHHLTQEIIKPFHSKNWSAKDWKLQQTTEEILGQDKWWFRAAGEPWFLHLMRSISYWAYALKELDVRVDLQEFMLRAVDGMQISNDNTLRTRLQQLLSEQNQKLRLSKYLKVRVLENQVLLVEVTLPAVALEDIEYALSEQVLNEIERQKLNLNEIKKNAIDHHYAPGDLLNLQLDQKHYHVWLE